MKGGYAGKLLFVDLSTGLIQEEPLSDEMAKQFIRLAHNSELIWP